MTTTSIKRGINGFLLLDKPLGITSNRALTRAKHLFQAKKAGHTGSLDPLASGMLPICFGEATKFSQYLLDADKTYEVDAQLGIRTETGDAEGTIIAQQEAPCYSLTTIERAFDHFRGEIKQIPPMYSALKHQGQPLYQLARHGITLDRPARTVRIYELNVLGIKNSVISFNVRCSKGTYIRSLVDDLGQHLGCGAHVIRLRRVQVGDFTSEPMYSLAALEDRCQRQGLQALDQVLLPVNKAVSRLPRVIVSEDLVDAFRKGQMIKASHELLEGMVALESPTGLFIGVGEVLVTKLIAPRRVVCE